MTLQVKSCISKYNAENGTNKTSATFHYQILRKKRKEEKHQCAMFAIVHQHSRYNGDIRQKRK
jgi:hypothetical protein